MKKLLVLTSLVVGVILKAQVAFVSTGSFIFKVTRLNSDSVEVKWLQKGEVQSVDTMSFSDFTTLTGGFEIVAGNLKNPAPVALTLEQTKQARPSFKSELKDYWKRVNTPGTSDHTILWGGVGLGIGYIIFKWISLEPANYYIPSGFNNIPNNGNGSSQCSAIAASTGQRCKRSRESGSIYCWQHH